MAKAVADVACFHINCGMITIIIKGYALDLINESISLVVGFEKYNAYHMKFLKYVINDAHREEVHVDVNYVS